MHGSYEVECYTTLAWKGLLDINTLVYLAYSQVTIKMNVRLYY
jgi:hypothetical protein